ncbi:hypothetical protein A2U01_0115384 [Trifolium medium]|uniref:Uncharacterized protein n=1 Tax=Trifolium medium TaxID=97028 RepID=A0A392W0Y2_9FABA|nr:hypothetical protein [Trifolium medium]
MKGRYNLGEAGGGWYLGQGSSGTWTWQVILNWRVQGGWRAVRWLMGSPSI